MCSSISSHVCLCISIYWFLDIKLYVNQHELDFLLLVEKDVERKAYQLYCTRYVTNMTVLKALVSHLLRNPILISYLKAP